MTGLLVALKVERRVSLSALHEMLAEVLRKLLLAFIFSLLFVMCCLKVSNWSWVTPSILGSWIVGTC